MEGLTSDLVEYGQGNAGRSVWRDIQGHGLNLSSKKETTGDDGAIKMTFEFR